MRMYTSKNHTNPHKIVTADFHKENELILGRHDLDDLVRKEKEGLFRELTRKNLKHK